MTSLEPMRIPTLTLADRRGPREATLALLADTAKVAKALADYYDPAGRFAGSFFLDLPNDPGNLDAVDLYALSTLDVTAGPAAGRRLLLPGETRTAVLAALASAHLPADLDLRDASSESWAAAAHLYDQLHRALGANPWVTASKLCARKRPSFFPVRDSVVTIGVLQGGQMYLRDWAMYRDLISNSRILRRLNAGIHAAEEQMQSRIADPELRLLDVVLWRNAPPGARLRARRR